MDYTVIDVFTSQPLKGNPVAVVLDADGLSDLQMQQIARWTNLSETTFVLPKTDPKADYRLRIFTPAAELSFAGHPSLGTAYALHERGLIEPTKTRIVQECGRGLIPIDIQIVGSATKFAFGIDGIKATPVDIGELDGCLPGLTLLDQPLCVNLGPRWVVVKVNNSSEELLKHQPDQAKIAAMSRKLDATGICVFAASHQNTDDIEMRTFAPYHGVNEDPVCGSGNAAVAFYRKLQRPYLSSQGAAIGRAGEISVRYDSDMIWVGGSCCSVVNGSLNIK